MASLPNLANLSVEVPTVRAESDRKWVVAMLRLGNVLFDVQGHRGAMPNVNMDDFKTEFFRLSMGPKAVGGSSNNTVLIAGSPVITMPSWFSASEYGVVDVNEFLSYRGRVVRNGLAFRWTRSHLERHRQPTKTSLEEELYLTLRAARMKVGPPVYAAALFTFNRNPELAYPRLYMVLGGGEDSGNLLRTRTPREKWGPLMGRYYADACGRAARAGLLLLDIKPGNAIYVRGCDDDYVQMIDFASDFTVQLFDGGGDDQTGLTACLAWINMLLLAAFIRCHMPESFETVTTLVATMRTMSPSESDMCSALAEFFHSSPLPDYIPLVEYRKSDRYNNISLVLIFQLQHYVLSQFGRGGVCPYDGWETGPDAPSLIVQLEEWLVQPPS